MGPDDRARRGPILARQLQVVLQRALWIDPAELSDDPAGVADDGLPPGRDRAGTIETAGGPVDVLLERVRLPDGPEVWRIASATVAQLPALYDEFNADPLTELLPAALTEIRFLQVRLWKWIALLLLIVVAAAVSWLVTSLLLTSARALAQRTAFDDASLEPAVGPGRLTVAVLVFAAGTYALALPVPVYNFFAGVQQALTIFAVAWLLVRLVDVLARTLEARLVAGGKMAAISVVPLGRRTVKVFLGVLAVIAMLQNFGFNVTGLLAGLGVGGLAVALAAQKTVENLFGGITMIADQPVRVGDFCRFGDRVGTVEDIGLRSTRVRTLDRTVVSVPNAEFSSLQLENFKRRDRIWLHATIGLRYETTPDQLRWILVELKRLLLAHPKVDPDPARARFLRFGAYSLDVEIFAYVSTTDINEFLAVQEDIFLRIMDLVGASGSGFAFPSRTIYAAPDSGLDETRRKAAEDQVRQWRTENRLFLPDPPAKIAASLAATLDYPPAGSATRDDGAHPASD
jgi:MscS family membrane protein